VVSKLNSETFLKKVYFIHDELILINKDTSVLD
jgi:hypothetical protein